MEFIALPASDRYPPSVSNRRLCLSILLLLCATVLPGIDRPFFSRGEAREALVPLGMLTTGNWVAPPVYHGDVPSKPPMTHWIAAGVATVTGDLSEWVVRTPSWLMAILLPPIFFLVVSNRRGREFGLVATLVLCTSFEWFRSGTTARVDMFFTAMLTVAWFGIVRSDENQWRSISWWLPVGAALATLTKGPVALILVGGVVGAILLIRGKGLIGWAFPLLLVSAIPYLVWFWLASEQRGDAVGAKVFEENIARFLGTMTDEPHHRSAPSLWLLGFVGLLPWSLFLVALRFRREEIRSWWSRFRKDDSLNVVAVVVAAVTVVFFSLPAGKRGVYLLPAYPAFALLLTGIVLPIVTRWRASKAHLFRGVSFVVALLLWVTVAVAFLPEALDASDLVHEVWPLLLLSALVATCWFLFGRARLSAEQLLGGAVVLLLIVANGVVAPAVAREESEGNFAREIREIVAGQPTLYSVASEFYGVSFYLRKPMKTLPPADLPAGSLAVLFERDRHYLDGLTFEVVHRSIDGVRDPDEHAMLIRVVGHG